MGTGASYVVAHIDATSSFEAEMRIEKVGGNRKGPAISCHRHLSLGEEKKMRFSRGEVVFYRLEIRSKATNVAEVNEEIVEGGAKTLGVDTRGAVRPGGIYGPLPRRGLRGWCWSRHINFEKNYEKCVCNCACSLM